MSTVIAITSTHGPSTITAIPSGDAGDAQNSLPSTSSSTEPFDADAIASPQTTLTLSDDGSKETPPKTHFALRALMTIQFLMGGVLFVGGSICYLYPLWVPGGITGALMYAIGSALYMLLDAKDWFFSWWQRWWMTVNYTFAVWGTMLFTAGSIGYLPSILEVNADFGPWAFIAGGICVGISQTWKLFRITCRDFDDRLFFQTFSARRWFESMDNFTLAGIEFTCAVGGWFFVFSTLMYEYGNIDDEDFYMQVARLWTAGSVFFLISGLFACYRCFIMDL